MRTAFTKIAALIVAVIVCAAFSGCSFLSDWLQDFSGDKTSYSKAVGLYSKTGDYHKMLAAMEKADQELAAGNDYQKFKDYFEQVEQYYMYFVNDYQVKYVNYCMYGKEADAAAYEDYYSKYLEASKWVDNIQHALMYSAFRENVYPDMSDEEIIAQIGDKKPDEYYGYLDQMKQMETEIQSYDQSKLKKVAKEKYVEYVKVANALAKSVGYNDYMDYSYENVYGRDYSPADTVSFGEYVEEYVWQRYQALSDELSGKLNTLQWKNASDYNLLARYFEGNGFDNYMNEFEAFARFLGGKYEDRYDYLWKNKSGYYFISNETNAFNGAYTDMFYALGEPYVFFGSGYTDISTIVHEFGHYYVFSQTTMEQCYDLDEIQSQGGEMLFLQYFLQKNDLSAELKACMEEYVLVDAYLYISLCAMVNEFERAVYKAEEINADTIDQALKSTYTLFGGKGYVQQNVDFDMYWKLVCMQAPCYYISYSTSLLSSLEIGELAKKDLQSGKRAYLNVCEYDYENLSYLEVLDGAGLSNPFEEQSFRKIFGGKDDNEIVF